MRAFPGFSLSLYTEAPQRVKCAAWRCPRRGVEARLLVTHNLTELYDFCAYSSRVIRSFLLFEPRSPKCAVLSTRPGSFPRNAFYDIALRALCECMRALYEANLSFIFTSAFVKLANNRKQEKTTISNLASPCLFGERPQFDVSKCACSVYYLMIPPGVAASL